MDERFKPPTSRGYAAVAVVAALLGLLFATYSTLDYAAHLDRRLHDMHCSFIPGASPSGDAEACRAAMYSPYSALLKDEYWGGIPISLFALGAFAFYLGFAVYLLVAGRAAPRSAVRFFGIVSFAPLTVSVMMFVISVSRLGQLCKTCVGIYFASILLAVAGGFALASLRHRPASSVSAGAELLVPLAGLVVLGASTLVPAVVYAGSLPDHRPFLTRCGELKVEAPKVGELVPLRGVRPVRQAMFFEDPLCPTCKAFHERLELEGVLDRLDAKLVLFPLDSECNWMLSEPLHPGACLVSKAVLCGGDQAKTVLGWAYEEQERLTAAGKAGPNALKELLRVRFGDALIRCVDDRKTDVRLNQHLHFASENKIPVSTPQMYLGKQRICDEDTDIGLRYTLTQLAPEVLR
ncbi:MAG: vitamin K epoxide reductase family protein [Pseudomonadota bacterium]|nr:MAG: hypothetical protein DIU78_01545 [Pseudomonadota bacterium]